jgi:hypothetical protein
MRRPHRALVLVATLAAASLLSTSVLAVDRRVEAAAKTALKRAADDYLGTDFAAGAARLQRAIRACGTKKCSTETRTLLLRDLGTMQFRAGDMGAAKRAWAEALKADPSLALNPDYETPDLRTAWDDLKGTHSGTGSGGGGAAEQPTGDFAHTPATEQKVNTPLPVYVEYAGTSPVARVIVKYQGAGASGWSRVDLKRLGGGWGAVIPCGDVRLGTMRYWIQGFDDAGDPIASSGDPKHPYTVPIQKDISVEAPHLPGKSAPRACGADNDCPPGMPGCPTESPPGESEEETPHEKPSVTGKGFARLWVGVSAELPELSVMPTGNDLCKLSSTGLITNSIGAFCTNPDGTDFPSRASPVENGHLSQVGQAGHSSGGLQVGDVRVMGAFDYALSPSFLLGARFGYVANAYPGQAAVSAGHAFAPHVDLEARATYLFGDEPLTHVGFAPMAFAGVGISEFDTRVTSVVTLDNVAGQQPVNIWVTDAPFFIALGMGVRYQFSLRAAFTAAARANVVIGGNGLMLTYGPEVGVLYGF